MGRGHRSMKTTHYALPAILLHWVQAGLIIFLLWLGWSMLDLPKGVERSAAYNLHKSLGLLLFGLTLLRLGWRWRHPVTALPAPAWEAQVVRYTHGALYAMLLLAPLAGYLASSFTPYAIKFFGLALPKAGGPDETWNALFKQLHRTVVWGGTVLILLHIAGALRHLLHGDRSIWRILPGRLLKK